MARSSRFYRGIAPTLLPALAVVLLFAAEVGAIPISYTFSGVISSYTSFFPSSEAGLYNHPTMAIDQSVDGIISWDTDLVPDYSDPHYAEPRYMLPMNGISLMSLNIGAGVRLDFDYSYYVAEVDDSDSGDTLHLYNLGTRPFDFENQRYAINLSDFFFFGAADLFDGEAYPEGIDLALFQTGRLVTSIDGFVDLRDNSHHNYLAPFQIDFDSIQVQAAVVPEPSKAVMMILCVALLIGWYFYRHRLSSDDMI